MAGPLIVTAELAPEDFSWLEALRRHHFPPERNQLSAHLTMFHSLPPSAEGEIRQALKSLSKDPAPRAFVSSVMNLGGGVAFRIASEKLDRMRGYIADHFHGLLTAQDAAGWSAHVTIQNKVAPRVARELIDALGTTYDRRPVRISGLGLHRYLGGPWERLQVYPFRG